MVGGNTRGEGTKNGFVLPKTGAWYITDGNCRNHGLFAVYEEKIMKTAVLVDGGFYRKRATALWGMKTPEDEYVLRS